MFKKLKYVANDEITYFETLKISQRQLNSDLNHSKARYILHTTSCNKYYKWLLFLNCRETRDNLMEKTRLKSFK